MVMARMRGTRSVLQRVDAIGEPVKLQRNIHKLIMRRFDGRKLCLAPDAVCFLPVALGGRRSEKTGIVVVGEGDFETHSAERSGEGFKNDWFDLMMV